MGMRYVHAQDILHRDLKPSNILLDKDWRAKISDFGLSRPISADGPPTENTGTVCYAAPEQLSPNSPHTTKTDVFSFGLVLYEIISGAPVFARDEPWMNIVRRLRSRQFPVVLETFGSLMQSLIPRCWSNDPQNRPSFQDILTEFQAADFRILPSVDQDLLKKSVDEVLEWEARNVKT
jgi:serine/threonine protein kinase